MLKILKAILNAVRTSLDALFNTATWPFRVLFGGSAAADYDDEELPEPQDFAALDDPVAEREHEVAEGLKTANALITHCALCVVDDGPTAFAHDFPDELKQWARGLSKSECYAILDSDERSVYVHISGLFALKGVRPVGPLPPAVWDKEPSAEPADDVIFTPGAAFAR